MIESIDIILFKSSDPKNEKLEIENESDIEVEVSILFEYSPEEKRTYYYPGCSASVSIIDLYINNTKVSRDNYSEEEIRTYFWEQMINKAECRMETGDDNYHRMQEEKFVLGDEY